MHAKKNIVTSNKWRLEKKVPQWDLASGGADALKRMFEMFNSEL